MTETVESLTARLRAIVEAHRGNVARTSDRRGYRDLIDAAEEALFVESATVEAFGRMLEVVRVEGTEFLRVIKEDGLPLVEQGRGVSK